MTQSIADATRYGSTPMSMSRAGVAGALLVCSVDSTRWPVSAASIAIRALSRSRISPTMMMSGSARTIARSPVAKVSPARSKTCICLTPLRRYSTGSSIVMIVFSGELTTATDAYSEVDLPEPVGPGREDRAVRALQRGLHAGAVVVAHAELAERQRPVAGVEDAHDGGLAVDERHGRHAHVDAAAVEVDASCGRPAACGARRCRGRARILIREMTRAAWRRGTRAAGAMMPSMR